MAPSIPSGARFAADVSDTLTEHKIPHLLWGELALALAGSNSSPPSIDFIIPDLRIYDAQEFLYEGGFGRLCGNLECPVLTPTLIRPTPDIHFHLEGTVEEDDVKLLGLYDKSRTVWWLPNFTMDPPAEDDGFYMLSTDPRLPPLIEGGGCGPWTEHAPMKILNPSALTQAYIFLLLRDVKHEWTWKWWTGMMNRLVEDNEAPQTSVPKVMGQAGFQLLWRAFHSESDPLEIWGIIEELREIVQARGLLPVSPFEEYPDGTNMNAVVNSKMISVIPFSKPAAQSITELLAMIRREEQMPVVVQGA